jgi:hypothetical protein
LTKRSAPSDSVRLETILLHGDGPAPGSATHHFLEDAPRMFTSIKRLMGTTAASGDEGQILSAWAKAEGLTFKRVNQKAAGGFVVESGRGWRAELGPSQRPYIIGKELRFRGDTGMHGDVQLVFCSKVAGQMLESDVFSRYTNAMQTQIDNTMPDEMRWLAMHQRVALPGNAMVARRFAVFCNAESVAQMWLNEGTLQTLESAAGSWWTDNLMVVLTLNRGLLTLRMAGQPLEPAQLKIVSELFQRLFGRMREVAKDVS